MSEIKRIGILTSGGDAPGMNAAIRAVVRTAVTSGISCLGIRRGYNGLINGDVLEMNERSVDGIITKGGTMLYTARCDEFKTEPGLQKAVSICKYLGIDGLVAIGGDGTYRGLLDLSRHGVAVIGIPGTIDNDIACTHYTLGFDTACNTAIEAVDKLRDTMQSHERCSVVEVMGHTSGNLAMYVGIACGAAAMLVPEVKVDLETELFEKMRLGRIRGRNHHIIIVAEGYGNATDVAAQIRDATGIDTRVTILGHVQRGGSPSARDRYMATMMGCRAVDLLLENRVNRIISLINDDIVDLGIEDALAAQQEFSTDVYKSALRVAF